MSIKKVKRSKEIFERYHKETGIQKQFFAKKLGITPAWYYQIIIGMRRIPPEIWHKIIDESGGAITLTDLMSITYGDNEALTFAAYGTKSCSVEMKTPIKARAKSEKACCDSDVGVEDCASL